MWWSSFDYEEPSTSSALVLISYFLLLNVFGWITQNTIGAGLIGQILLGIIYGTPLSGWLDEGLEAALVDIGYVGLLLVVFEGGLTTSPKVVLRLLSISTIVALTGLSLPIGLSFLLIPLSGSGPLHAFAAGSALSSTSLGTVLTLLNPRVIGFDLRSTGVGTVLLSAAVLDDVVALVLVKILSVIGNNAKSDGPGSNGVGQEVGRTIGVTIGLTLVVGILAHFVLCPLYTLMIRNGTRWQERSWGGKRLIVLLMGVWFIGLIAAAGYAGTSVLFGAYLAGIALAYVVERHADTTHTHSEAVPDLKESSSSVRRLPTEVFPGTARHQHLSEPLRRVSTYPARSRSATQQPDGEDTSISEQSRSASMGQPHSPETPIVVEAFEVYIVPVMDVFLLPAFFGSIGYSIPFVPLWRGRVIWRGIIYSLLMALGKLVCGVWLVVLPGYKNGSKGQSDDRHGARRDALLVGLAMIARGEIGLLISQVAYHTSEPLLTEDEFLQVTWAIVLCTIAGPIGLSVLVLSRASHLRNGHSEGV